jgi:hypothetical protein
MFTAKFKVRSGPVALAVAGLALFMSMGGTGYAIGAASHPSASTPDWHALSLTGDWLDGGFNTPTPAYYVDAQGVLHLRGDVVSGTTKAPVFTLPKGARPAHVIFLSIYANGGDSGGLTIRPTGKAYLRDNDGGAAVSQWASFDGVSFPISS